MGIAVVMDLVHAHYVKNLNEGIASLDGTDHLYSKPGEAGYQPYWDSMLFDYGKNEVTHFLLSNVKFWLDEFHFDGFRFDGVTSMIYHHHGYTEFDSRDKFFGHDVNTDALTYLTLANHLVHEFRPGALTIAEDVSGMPGMALPEADGGVGFDYRLGMAIPDFWIRLLKEVPDEEWNIWEIWNIMTDRLPGVHTVAYAESHDQALVGDKTIAFRLMDASMYTSMARGADSVVVERGMALHKMIRLVTIAAGGEAYLNFMGNEFGHPEWIDFPRDGNGWSYAHARRQWSLADSPFLRYSQLLAFDGAMLAAIKEYGVLCEPYPWRLQMDEGAHTMAFARGGLVFVFNWHPADSLPDYAIEVPEPGKYRLALSTDEKRFGGQGRENPATEHFTYTVDGRHYMQIYNICRTAAVFAKV
jgi:1,4-alpha-glucan branching enzyme